MLYPKKYTPWGYADHRKEYAPGIEFYGTPSHGGIKLDRAHNAAMPDYLRNQGGWYEEDCEWCKVAVVFPEAFQPHEIHAALDTLRGWFPDQWERFTGTKLQPGESYIRDEKRFYAEHAADWLVISAFGNWHAKVPEGMVGVVATRGGLRSTELARVPERWFLVPEPEYNGRKGIPTFIVDPAKHAEIDALQ